MREKEGRTAIGSKVGMGELGTSDRDQNGWVYRSRLWFATEEKFKVRTDGIEA